MRDAFTFTNGMLLAEMARSTRYMSEERVRSSFVDGLILARPSLADRVHVERTVSWNGRPCWKTATHGSVGQGRTIQHDVFIESDDDAGLACELKWLKQQKAKRVAQDVWKLALSRGTTGDNRSVRTFLARGGERVKFSATLRQLRQAHLPIQWSSRGGTRGQTPRPTKPKLSNHVATVTGRDALRGLLAWGRSPNRHLRTPVACRDELRLACRASWELALPGRSWCFALIELHARGCTSQLSWPSHRPTSFSC